MFGLICRAEKNPLPPNVTSKSRGHEHSSFFIDKILNIRKTLDNFEKKITQILELSKFKCDQTLQNHYLTY